MYPNMTKYLPFIYDETGYFGNDKTFIITSQDDSFSLKILVAILNSKLAKLWIRRHCPELGEDRREIRKVYFENFPIPIESGRYDRGSDNGACPVDPTGSFPSIGLPSGSNPAGLSELADQMLSLHSQLQQKRQRFIHRLQENLGVQKITATLERFDEVDFKKVLAELKKQKISLTLTQQDEWEDYFTQYKADCNALTAQIIATDKEIDQMVYQLYGLTEDEIKVVEG